MKLLLTSQGLPSELKEVFLSLLTKSPEKTRVLFITTAAYGESESRPQWLDVYKNQLYSYGIKKVEELDIQSKQYERLEKAVNAADIIFVNGGNTFFLLYWIRKTGFDRLILNAVTKGKLYIGISAGSNIACPTIEQSLWKSKDKNKVNLTDLSALNLVPFLITVHYKREQRPVISKAAKTTKSAIVALNDTQAILIEDGKCKLVGKGPKVFFNGFQEIF